MINANLNDNIKKSKQIFTATFVNYFSKGINSVFVCFKDIHDDRGNFLKSRFVVNVEQAVNVLGELIFEERVTFYGKLKIDVNETYGCTFTDIEFPNQKEKIHGK